MKQPNQKKEASMPKFISNAPCGEDLFEGKSQQKIAYNIASILINDDQCKVIGIDGGWGSGKSNLVYQVREKVKDKYHFYIYDAWGHQEDLQRRSILEELTDNLIEAKLLPQEKWKEKLKKVLAKRREIGTETIPKLSLGLILTGAAIVLAPLLEKIADNIECLFWKILITAIPIIILLALYIYHLVKEKKFKAALTKMYFIYADKKKEDTTFETISEDEPSVRKFRKWLGELSRDLKGKGLVIVFDNMDRLPKEKVQELWSSIHIFFSEGGFETIRVIIPFDRNHIKTAFKTEDIKDGNENVSCFGDDYIDKTFNVVYRVSPPIMTDWKQFFMDQWALAFGGSYISVDYNNVVQIFDLLSKDITPRKIIAFINEFVSIKQVVKDTIPNRYVALYIFGKSSIHGNNAISEIIKPTYLGIVDFLYQNDDEMPKYIAALHFQVEPEKAIQVVFGNRLVNSLNENNQEEVSEIKDIEGFNELLDEAISSVSNYHNATVALDSCMKQNEYRDEIQYRHIWNCLYMKVDEIPQNKIFSWQICLLNNIHNKSEFTKRIIFSLQSDPDFKSIIFAECLNNLSKHDENTFSYEFPSKTVSALDWFGFVNLTKSDWEKYKLYCPEDELESYFENYTFGDDLETLEFIPYIKDKYTLKSYKVGIKNKFKAINQNIKPLRLSIILKRYEEVFSKPFDDKLSDAIIYTVFQKTKPEDDLFYDLLAMRISYLDAFDGNYFSIFEKHLNNKENSKVAAKVAQVIECYIPFGDLLVGMVKFKKYPVYCEVVKALIENPTEGSLISLPGILKNFDNISDDHYIFAKDLFERLNEIWLKSKEEISIEKIHSILSSLCVYSCLETENELTKYILSKEKDYLNSLSIENWVGVYTSRPSTEWNILKEFKSYVFSQNAKEAFKIALNSIASDNLPIPNKADWDFLYERFISQNVSLISCFKDVRDTLIRGGNCNLQLFQFFGDWLFKYAKLEEKKESIRTIFKPEIINDDNMLSLIINNQDTMHKIVEIADEEADDFKELINEKLHHSEDSRFISFAEGFGLKKDIVTKTDDDLSFDSE